VIRIVIVDDLEIVREGLKTILQSEPDFRVVADSATADELTELVDGTHPDVVLLDARLPGITRTEAWRRPVATHSEIPVPSFPPIPTSNWSRSASRQEPKATASNATSGSASKRAPELCTAVVVSCHPRSRPQSSTAFGQRRQCQRRHRRSRSATPSWRSPRLIAGGLSNREIADRVHLSPNTV
jgi:DNA-binding NarL/FixJ family response regulator